MTHEKERLVKEYAKEVRNRAGNFDLKVQTSTVIFNFFKSKGYEFHFAPKLKPTDNSKQVSKTPDFHAHKEKMKDIIGEIKQSLPKPLTVTPENPLTPEQIKVRQDEYDKKVSQDLHQLQEYTQDLVGISTPHDIFFSSPSWCNEAIAFYTDKIANDPQLKDKVIILKYHWMRGNSHSQLTIQKIFGNFSDHEINKEFNYKDYLVGENDLEQIQGYYKILYTEEEYNQTPVEYIMLVLWHNVFPEVIKTAEFDKAIERIKKGQNTLEFDIDQIMSVLDKMYLLKTSHSEKVKQFSKQMILDAMKSFEKMNKAQSLNDSKTNPRYLVTHTKLATSKTDLLDHLIMELNKDEFEKRAELEIKKTQNMDLRIKEWTVVEDKKQLPDQSQKPGSS